MSLFGKKLILPLFAFLFLLLVPLAVFAQSNPAVGQKTVILASDEVIDSDYFAAGNVVSVGGTVNGDAYVAGGQVDINGTINGDLLVAGGQVTVRGKVAQNVRAAGGNVIIEGEVGRNISVAGGNVTLDKSAQISGNTAIAGGNIDVLSQVNDLSVAGGNVKVDSTVLGNLTAGVGTLTILGDSKIDGNLEYWSVEKATIAPGVEVAGKTTFHETAETNVRRQEAARRFFAAVGMFVTLISFSSSLVVGLLLIWLVPVYTQKTADVARSKFWLSLLLGFVTIVVVPVAVLILLITLVGIPVGLILLFGYFVVIYLSKLFAVLAFGQYVAGWAKWKLNSYWIFVATLAAYYMVGFVPVIGPFVRIVVLFAGVGAIVIQKKYYFLKLRDKKLL